MVRLISVTVFSTLEIYDEQPNHGWRHLWREIARGTKMKPELCDYMCGHEGKSGTSADMANNRCPPSSDRSRLSQGSKCLR